MERMKMLIADASEQFVMSLADALRGAYILRTARDGREAMELVDSFRPDILVIDLMLPGLDGISVLRQTAAAGQSPMVLAMSRYISDYVAETAAALGVGYLMLKPCDPLATAARISDLSQRLRQPLFAQPDPRTAVSNLLLALGVPTKLRGYACTREAILEKIRDPAQSVTKELYPTVAAICGGNAVQVERSIRSAIAAAWVRGDHQLWQVYFPGETARPTNASFISRLADWVSLGTEN